MHLADDFPGSEIAHQPLGAGMAERAGERAADLARYAQRAAPGFRNIDALHLMRMPAGVFPRQPQQPFAGAVGGYLFGNDLGARQGEATLQRGAQFLRHVGHHVESGGAAHIDPVPQLLHPHFSLCRRHADLGQRRDDFGARQPDQRRSVRRHIACERRLLDHGRHGRGIGGNGSVEHGGHEILCRKGKPAVRRCGNISISEAKRHHGASSGIIRVVGWFDGARSRGAISRWPRITARPSRTDRALMEQRLRRPMLPTLNVMAGCRYHFRMHLINL